MRFFFRHKSFCPFSLPLPSRLRLQSPRSSRFAQPMLGFRTAQFTPALQIAGGSNVYLTLVPVPEPATVLAVAAAGLGTVRLRHRLTASSRRPG